MVAPANKTFTGAGTVTGSGNIMGSAANLYSLDLSTTPFAQFNFSLIGWSSMPQYLIDNLPEGTQYEFGFSVPYPNEAMDNSYFLGTRAQNTIIDLDGRLATFIDTHGLTNHYLQEYPGFTISWSA